jgi:hypothetical protein
MDIARRIVERDRSAGAPLRQNRRVSIEGEMIDVMEKWYAIKAAKASQIRL